MSSRLTRIILTHFKPVHAREAFPCFDEPSFKAKFQLIVHHENNTHIISNWDESVRQFTLLRFVKIGLKFF